VDPLNISDASLRGSVHGLGNNCLSPLRSTALMVIICPRNLGSLNRVFHVSSMLRTLLRRHSSHPPCGFPVVSPTLPCRWFSIHNSRMGETVRMGDRPTPVPLPNSEQFFLDSDQGSKYLIQLSWPLHWPDNCSSDRGALPIM
jgi:hypothetical protein